MLRNEDALVLKRTYILFFNRLVLTSEKLVCEYLEAHTIEGAFFWMVSCPPLLSEFIV